MASGIDIFSQGVITHNVILFQGLGIYALLRYTKSLDVALKAAVVMLTTTLTACGVLWAIQPILPTNFSMILPITLLIAFASGLIWHQLLAKYLKSDDKLPLLPAFMNSALVGVLLTLPHQVPEGINLMGYGFAGAIGYGVVLLVMTGIRERLEVVNVPKPFRGAPILLISAALLALALMGYRL